jgi:cellulose synthase/poly-beta-1,6-N-acetylglucosamine synthase-like glycosyltransferase
LTVPRDAEFRRADLPRVSLVIPSYNEEAVLERSIGSVLVLDYPADKLELIYVYESVSTDRMEQIIEHAARLHPHIKPVRRITTSGGKAAVTNSGLQFATGDVIGIFDADHSLGPDIVRHAVAHLRDRQVGCVRGRCRTINRTQSLVARLVAIERDVVERFHIHGAWCMGGASERPARRYY